jgi:hypothetical protein
MIKSKVRKALMCTWISLIAKINIVRKLIMASRKKNNFKKIIKTCSSKFSAGSCSLLSTNGGEIKPFLVDSKF